MHNEQHDDFVRFDLKNDAKISYEKSHAIITAFFDAGKYGEAFWEVGDVAEYDIEEVIHEEGGFFCSTLIQQGTI